MVESNSKKVMPAEEEIDVYTLLNGAGVELRVDGGWSIDALLVGNLGFPDRSSRVVKERISADFQP